MSERVLHLDHTSAPGGAEFALARMLQAGAEWMPVLSVPPSGRAGVYASLEGRVPVRVTGVVQRSGVSAGGVRQVAAAGARLLVQAAATRISPAFRTADLVDANTARAAAYGSLAALTSGVPFVVHLRDLVDAESLGGLGWRVMTRVALPRADGVIANSRTTLASALPYLRPDAATVVIPSAAGIGRSSSPARSGPLRIGMLARIDPWKGQALLLDAFGDAFPDGDVRLEFAGGAPFGHEDFADELRRTARERGLGDRVEFLGHVEDVDAVLRRWDIGVQASLRAEPLGQNVLQYLAAGLPSIVADEGGPAEWIEDDLNGIRFAPRDRAALAEALRRLGADAALRTRISAAAAATPGLLTDVEVMRAHGRFYRAVMRSRPQRRV